MGFRLEGVGAFVLASAAAVVLLAVGAANAWGAFPADYDVIRVDDPTPSDDGNFGLALAGVGDLNDDGIEDLLAGTDKHGREVGQAFVIGGDGSIIRELQLPDPDSTGSGRDSGFGAAVSRIGVNDSGAPFGDVGSCPAGDGGDADAECDAATVGAPDGIPDLLVTASGVDVNATTGAIDDSQDNDLGVAYVFDGATGALLQRLMMPQADRELQDTLGNDPRFGRAAISPAGFFPCDENGNDEPGGGSGISHGPGSSCPAIPEGVAAGDADGGGAADIIVAATDFDDRQDNTNAGSDCSGAAPLTVCARTGRVYVWHGEDLAGTSPSTVDDAPDMVITDAHADPGGGVRIGTTLIPVGDLGECTEVAPEPGDFCGGGSRSTTPDGNADFVATGPDFSGAIEGVGSALLLDGADGSILKRYDHPEPQPNTALGLIQNGLVQPAFGDLGQSANWDVYVPDVHHNTGWTAGGRGYLFNGQYTTRSRFIPFSQLNDPTPAASSNFGASAAGVGDVYEATAANELLVGSIGPHAPGTNEDVINDVHFFEPKSETPLQTIADPDQQPGASFGVGVVPLGDINSDGFLDLAVSSGFFDLQTASGPCSATPCGDAGRVYIFTSADAPASPTTAEVDGGELSVVAADGVGNNIVVEQLDDETFRVSDEPNAKKGLTGAAVEPGAGCAEVDADTVECTAAVLDRVLVDAGNRADRVNLDIGVRSKAKGGGGGDVLIGGGSADVLAGQGGNDKMKGKLGDDKLKGARGKDAFIGSRGGDVVRAEDNTKDKRIACGKGRDKARVDRRDPNARGCEKIRVA